MVEDECRVYLGLRGPQMGKKLDAGEEHSSAAHVIRLYALWFTDL